MKQSEEVSNVYEKYYLRKRKVLRLEKKDAYDVDEEFRVSFRSGTAKPQFTVLLLQMTSCRLIIAYSKSKLNIKLHILRILPFLRHTRSAPDCTDLHVYIFVEIFRTE